jgi:phosphomannomutase/phosphoglucomutase
MEQISTSKIDRITASIRDGTILEKRIADARGRNILPGHFVEFGYELGSLLNRLGQRYFMLSGDARRDTYRIKSEITEGLAKQQIDVIDCGINNTTPLFEKFRAYARVSGANITASHQEKEYNGIKIAIEEEYSDSRTERLAMMLPLISNDKNRVVDAQKYSNDMYLGQLNSEFKNLVVPDDIRLIYDAFQGVSFRFFKEIADRNNLRYESNREFPDPEFRRTVSGPDPSNPDNLKDIQGRAYDIAFLADGDGDRMALALPSGLVHALPLNILRIEYQKKKQGNGVFVAEYSLASSLSDYFSDGSVNIVSVPRGRPSIISKMNELIKGGVNVLGGAEISYHNFDRYGFDDAVYNALEIIDYISILSSKRVNIIDHMNEIISKSRIVFPEIRVKSDYPIKEVYKSVMGSIPGAECIELTVSLNAKDKNALLMVYSVVYNSLKKYSQDLADTIENRKNELGGI